jgi:hypothetical protein
MSVAIDLARNIQGGTNFGYSPRSGSFSSTSFERGNTNSPQGHAGKEQKGLGHEFGLGDALRVGMIPPRNPHLDLEMAHRYR